MNSLNLNVELAAAVIVPLLLVGALFKNAFPKFPNRLIPLLTWALGIPAYVILSGDTTAKNWVCGLLVVATATGLHSGVKNTFAGGGGPKAVVFLLLVSPWWLAGCAIVREKATTTTTDPATGIVMQQSAETSIKAAGDAKTVVDKIRASAGKTVSVGASGVTEEANITETIKAVADGLAKLFAAGYQAGQAAKVTP